MSSSHRDLSRKNTAMTTPQAQPQIEPAAMSTPMTMRAVPLSTRSSKSQPAMTPTTAAGIIGTICFQLPPLRLMR